MKRVTHIVGARPNFMKMAPVLRALDGRLAQRVIHTGQHYDSNMSEVFFRQLGIGAVDVNLEVGSASHAAQTGRIMIELEPLLASDFPDAVILYGDVNSTIAAALVATKLGIPVAHVEAGLRSFDRTMPEEINRLVTDRLSDFLFTPSEDGNANLLAEGVPADKIHLVGNVMIDTLTRLLPHAEEALRGSALASWIGRGYALVTLHRPSNVDDVAHLMRLSGALVDIARELPVIFPVHPRTRARIQALPGVGSENLHLLDPLGYLEFLALQKSAVVVITDSGGIQEETTWLGVPCLTMRENTERPVTVTRGSNTLIGKDVERLKREVRRICSGEARRGGVPELWDGHAAERIADVLCS